MFSPAHGGYAAAIPYGFCVFHLKNQTLGACPQPPEQRTFRYRIALREQAAHGAAENCESPVPERGNRANAWDSLHNVTV